MAKAKRNIKTHPKIRDEDYPGADFLPPDREDQNDPSNDRGAEVIDVFGEDQTVTVATGDTGGADEQPGDDADATVTRTDATARAARATERRTAATSRVDTGGERGSVQDDGDSDFSRRTRKRIARERALVNRERALREQAQAQLEEERTARQQMADRLERIERTQAQVSSDADVKALEAKIAALQPQITQAMADANTQRAMELQIQLGELQSQLAVMKYDLQQRQAAARKAADTTQTRTARTDQTAADTAVQNAEAKTFAHDFKRANKHWWNRAVHKEAREDAIAIDREIMEEINMGDADFEAFSEEHAEELARRLHEAHPDLEIQDLAGVAYEFGDESDGDTDMQQRTTGRKQTTQQRRTPTQGSERGGRQTRSEVDLARAGKVTLTQEDFNTMRVFKMDPNNPQDKKYFAKEKMRSLLTGQRGGEQ